ncbi:MAG: molybdopterin molybdotransferase MoeA [Gammaproteobacteria bacterium]|nr:molybdopterin molybdotransferase MoeA [Gammaproteobacteria bacterium]
MLSLEDAQAAILNAIRPARAIERVALEQACGRFVAALLTAQVDHPAFDNSAMDGYALRVDDGRAGELPVAGESSGGDPPKSLAPRTAMRIFTGAPLPVGADTVVIQEDVERNGDTVRLPAELTLGENIRRRGEDFNAGDALYDRGRRLSALDVALLATAGVDHVPVYARPRAFVVATGNELVVPGRPLAPGQIYESNRLATCLQLRALGVDVIDGGTVRDEPAALRALLVDAAQYDFVITSGGASVGDHDLIKKIFGELGTIHLWKARIKPGKPIAFGHIGERTHFFALPGNPLSSLVTYKLFVEPAVIAWHHGTSSPLMLPAQAANDFRRRAGRTEFLRARIYVEGGRLLAEVLKGQGSHQLGPLRFTNGLIRVEADSSGFVKGDAVEVMQI